MSGVVVIDHGAGNYASVAYALARLGVDCERSADPRRVRQASHVILPGVGAAGSAMRHLRASGVSDVLPGLTQPVLGICLGMQLLHDTSEEDGTSCLGIVPGRATRLPGGDGLRSPHMGWNTLCVTGVSPLTAGLDPTEFVYFVHSYAVAPGPDCIAQTTYGATFSALVSRRNFHGAQFHPERSGKAGARVLANFLAL